MTVVGQSLRKTGSKDVRSNHSKLAGDGTADSQCFLSGDASNEYFPSEATGSWCFQYKQHTKARIRACCNSQSIAVHLCGGKTGVARVVLVTKQEDKWAEDTSVTAAASQSTEHDSRCMAV